MKQDYSIEIKNVSKIFRKNLKSFRSMAGYLLKRDSPDNFYALNDISLSLKPGETLGIIGKNGSGKSTLLKVIANITKSSSGTLKVKGKIASLIELGTGFHQELTGRENIFLYGAILGMSKKEINENFDKIVEFAELREWLDTPIKFYSSGMFARLGFAIIAHSNSDILLIDEAIAVGDEQFQQKCFKKIDEFKKDKKIIVLVSHSHEVISQHTERAIWLDKGKIMADGKSEEVVEKYMCQSIFNETNSKEKKQDNEKAEIYDCKIFNENSKETSKLEIGKRFQIKLSVKFFKDFNNVSFNVTFRDNVDHNRLTLHSLYSRNPVNIPHVRKNQKLEVKFDNEEMVLSPGMYSLSIDACGNVNYPSYDILCEYKNILNVLISTEKKLISPINMNYITKIRNII
ncbi:MAG: ABC transporter ATP-binding protein [bacterium]